MPRSPLPNISVPVLAVACWVDVVLELEPELDFLLSLPQAARNSANAPAPAVPPTALRNRLRSDGSVASRSMAPSCICRLHVLLVETCSRRGPSADQTDSRHNLLSARVCGASSSSPWRAGCCLALARG